MPLESSGQLQRLREVLSKMESVLVAFSGGVDSALVLKVAHEELGSSAVALTAVSPTFPPEELAEAEKVTSKFGIKHLLVDSHELERQGYVQNAGNRCYFCKTELFNLARDKAVTMGLRWVVDGTIVDDLGAHRPGLLAAKEQKVRHPLVEAGLKKTDVRRLAKDLGISVWDKPAFACLGSRFPVGTQVTLPRLMQVQRVESFLRMIGATQFRVRWHLVEDSPMARIEMDPSEMGLLLEEEIRHALYELCHAEGFKWVTMDLLGYQKGGLSHRISPEAHDLKN